MWGLTLEAHIGFSLELHLGRGMHCPLYSFFILLILHGAMESQSTSLLLPSQAAMLGSHLCFVPCMYKRVNPLGRADQLHHIYIAVFKHFNAISCAFSALKQRRSSCSRMAICALHVFNNISLIHIDFLSRRPRLNLLSEVRPTSIAAPAPPFSLPTPPLPLFNSKIY